MIVNTYKYLKENFKCFKREEYRKYNISDESKKVLCDIGLPNIKLNFIDLCHAEIENIYLENELIVIGNDYGTLICINSKNEIVAFDQENEYPLRFINNSLKCLLNFLIIYISYQNKLYNLTDEQIEKEIQEIRKKFNKIDKRALENEENWWSIILEQLELGLI